MSPIVLFLTHEISCGPKLQFSRLANISKCFVSLTFPLYSGYEAEPLWMITLWNKPLDKGDNNWSDTDTAPALWPNKVTRLESPPKLTMLFWTHCKAWIWNNKTKSLLYLHFPAYFTPKTFITKWFMRSFGWARLNYQLYTWSSIP